jgi:Protein of unknown function (DUF1553)/Protein of unknown function (DUF1549)/Planctomycete cytochrome C
MASGLRRFARLFAGMIATAAVAGVTRGGDVAPTAPAPAKPRPVNFAREVRPILSDNCFACHGPDDKQRKAKLRLDVHESVLAKLESGDAAVVPGKPDDSSLIFRVETDDAEMLMPPKHSGKSLNPQQIDVLKRWIAEGAPWGEHWAFEPPAKTEPPAESASNKDWARNAIDRFLLARIEAEGLKPSREADPILLLRRVYLDLTGLPPTPAEVDAFQADAAKGLDPAYEKVVDRLLDSPRYGEHMARFWLDAARYGDTHGLHLDNFREMWPYRDWVVNAFNANKPFDQFVVEQLAGDLLPNPTQDQLIATGFNRCHVSTSEGGSIEEEVYVRNVVDQVDTNGTVFLGLTVGCARCHDHKYDPVRQKDYYQLFAFFNNIDGPALDGNVSKWAPILQVPSPEQSAAIKAADAQLAELRGKLSAESTKIVASYDPKRDEGQSEVVQRSDYVWIDDAAPAGASIQGDGEFVGKPDHPVFRGASSLRVEASGLKQKIIEAGGPKLKVGEGDAFFAYVFIDPLNPPKEIMLQWRIGGQWSRRAFWGENVIPWGQDGTPERTRFGDLPASGKWVRLDVAAKSIGIAPGTVVDGWAFTLHDGVAYWDAAGLETWTPQEGQTFDSLTAWIRARKVDGGAGLTDPLKAIVKKPRAQRTDDERKQLLASFVENGWTTSRAILEPIRQRIAQTEAERKKVDEAISTTLVFRERTGEPKQAFVLNRGEYDQRRDKVGRSTPSFLPPLPAGAPVDRLGFARWLVAPNHPLTARVAVNRFWLHVFGTGIVKTAEDFGAQGEPPSHPELLDWLAVQFREEGWDVKRFVKRMVMSAAYRQTSQTSPESLAKDPDNRLLSRGPRFRLDAETLRDQAFFVSGMLVERMGGPSVKPPQPAGLWEAVAYTGSNTARFTADTGVEKVHRRSLYTFWKRTSPPPQMTTLDAPSRESCQVRRERTNTPLQALLLLNEPQYVEASRVLAERTLREAKPSPEERLRHMFRLATARQPDARDLAELSAALKDLSAHYAKQPDAAKALIQTGESKPDPKLDPSELAVWTMIGNILLNLDEVVTKG